MYEYQILEELREMRAILTQMAEELAEYGPGDCGWKDASSREEEADWYSPMEVMAKRALAALLRDEDLRGELIRSGYNGQYMLVGEFCELANERAEEMEGETPISARMMGNVLRRLGLRTGKRLRVGFPVMWDEEKVREIVEGVEEG